MAATNQQHLEVTLMYAASYFVLTLKALKKTTEIKSEIWLRVVLSIFESKATCVCRTSPVYWM